MKIKIKFRDQGGIWKVTMQTYLGKRQLSISIPKILGLLLADLTILQLVALFPQVNTCQSIHNKKLTKSICLNSMRLLRDLPEMTLNWTRWCSTALDLLIISRRLKTSTTLIREAVTICLSMSIPWGSRKMIMECLVLEIIRCQTLAMSSKPSTNLLRTDRMFKMV